jgi:hypothetical protein
MMFREMVAEVAAWRDVVHHDEIMTSVNACVSWSVNIAGPIRRAARGDTGTLDYLIITI